MNSAILVAVREYMENLRTVSFWIGMMILPIIYTLATLVPVWLEKTKPALEYVVIDESGWLADSVEAQIKQEDLTQILFNLSTLEPDLQVPPALNGLRSELKGLDIKTLNLCAAWMCDTTQEPPQELDAALVQTARESVPQALALLQGDDVKKYPQVTAGISAERFSLLKLPEADQETLTKMLADEDIFAWFVIGPDPMTGDDGSKYVSRNLTEGDLLTWYSARASSQIRTRRLEKENIDDQVAQWIQAPLQFTSRMLSDAGEEEAVQARDRVRQWVPVAFVYLLWISIFTASQMLLTGTIEEKSNRLIEVLLSSISPLQLMAGKVLGIAATGMTMVGVWVLCALGGARFIPALLGKNLDFNFAGVVGDPVYLISFLIYFMLGYLFYAAILVGIGSVCNTLKEAQNLMSPIIMMLFLPLMLMVPIGKDPNGLLAKVVSFIPPLTPFAMMNRAAGPPEQWEYVATTLLMIISIVFAFWAGARVFRIGILLTGKPPNLKEILRWIKAPVGKIPENPNI